MARPKALLLTIRRDNSEMEELAWSLGYDVTATVYQNRSQPDPRFYVGRGKLADARDVAKALGVDVVIVNEALKPNQIFNLHDFIVNGWDAAEPRVPDDLADALDGATEDGGRDGAAGEEDWVAYLGDRDDGEAEPPGETGAGANGERDDRAPEVFDRVRVILEIFSERARSQEARLQVELAKLQYESPLVKEFIHLLRKGERPGFLAGGEYEIQQYYDMINRRMAKIRDELAKVRLERDVRRKHRRRSGFHLVSLAGYTNAGKSTLLRALSRAPGEGAKPRRGRSGSTGADILVENRYFSTLGTKTRRAQSGKREILVTDTVGFIEDLPPWIVKAFHSTLEEIALADVIALVVDASDPYPELSRKISSSLSTLWEFDAQRHRDASEDRAREVPAAARGGGNGAGQGDGNEHDHGREHADGASEGGSDAGARGTATGAAEARDDVDDPRSPRAEAAPVSGPEDVRERQEAFVKDAAHGPQGLAPIIIVLNKADAVSRERFDENLRRLQAEGLVGDNWVAVSARRGAGLEALYEAVYALLPGYVTFTLELPPSPETESFIAWLHEETDVTDVRHGNVVCVTTEAKELLRDEIMERVSAVQGQVLETSPVT